MIVTIEGIFAICSSSRIFALRAFSSGLRFFRDISFSSILMLLFYTSPEVYTIIGMVSSQLEKLLGGIRLSGLRFFNGVLFLRKKAFHVFLCPNQFLHLISCLAVVRVGSFLLGQ